MTASLFRRKFVFVVSLSLLFLSARWSPAASRAISIVPIPVHMKVGKGSYTLTPDTCIWAERGAAAKAYQLAEMLSPATGYFFPVRTGESKAQSGIVIRLDPGLGHLEKEGYRLMVSPNRILITAPRPAGLFYAFQTLLQLLPSQILREAKVERANWSVPCVDIEDYPRFQWRGALLDVARHFMPKEFLKKFVDLLALHKMNRFHIHLTDDQGWRIEIKKYPRLTGTGAWREETVVGHLREKSRRFDGKRHGGFYTQEDLHELVAYARDRNVTIVPEIEMPGHAQAAIAAYPHLGNTGDTLPVRTFWGVNPNIFNANEETILFLQDVLSEVLEIFPSEFIHVGGDEARKDQWKASPQMQARIKELGLKDEHELQSYFIRRMDTFLNARGRRLIGWDEILEGGLAPNATVMSWRGDRGGIIAAKAGHDVVMAPTHSTYFDYYQSRDKGEPLAIGGCIPLRKVYLYDPVPSQLTTEEAKHILGTQGQIWTEYIPHPKKAEYMAFPRLIALGEVAWSPGKGRDYPDFLSRLKRHCVRLDILDVNYRPLDDKIPVGEWSPSQVSESYRFITVDITKHLEQPGHYEVAFWYTRGAHRLDMEWVEIHEDGKPVARDAHAGTTGTKNSGNIYRLNIPSIQKGAHYTLCARVRSDGGTDSFGEIHLERVKRRP